MARSRLVWRFGHERHGDAAAACGRARAQPCRRISPPPANNPHNARWRVKGNLDQECGVPNAATTTAVDRFPDRLRRASSGRRAAAGAALDKAEKCAVAAAQGEQAAREHIEVGLWAAGGGFRGSPRMPEPDPTSRRRPEFFGRAVRRRRRSEAGSRGPAAGCESPPGRSAFRLRAVRGPAARESDDSSVFGAIDAERESATVAEEDVPSFDQWEALTESPPPRDEPALRTDAAELQNRLSEHAPIDTDFDWPDVETPPPLPAVGRGALGRAGGSGGP